MPRYSLYHHTSPLLCLAARLWLAVQHSIWLRPRSHSAAINLPVLIYTVYMYATSTGSSCVLCRWEVVTLKKKVHLHELCVLAYCSNLQVPWRKNSSLTALQRPTSRSKDKRSKKRHRNSPHILNRTKISLKLSWIYAKGKGDFIYLY